MAIVKTIDFSDFREAFRAYDRTENFSRQGLEVLFEYLEELSDGIGEPVELDVIGLCCDYSEDTPEEIAESYSIDLPERGDFEDSDSYNDAVQEVVLDYLHDYTSVCGVTDSGTIVYGCF